MPVLTKRTVEDAIAADSRPRRDSAILPECANPDCTGSWLRVLRSRSVPVVDGGWLCSPECTRARIASLISRELHGYGGEASAHRHRVPIGLILLAEGWISQEQLRHALHTQKMGAPERLGSLLIKEGCIDEQRLTQALSLQWNCPVFSLEHHQAGPQISLVPRLLVDGFGLVPLRLSSTGILYVAFEDRMDYSLILGIERVTGLRVEGGLLTRPEMVRGHSQALKCRFPAARLIEAANAAALAGAMARVVEKERPAQVRIVRVHDLLWLRLWRHAEIDAGSIDGIEDVIGSLTTFQ